MEKQRPGSLTEIILDIFNRKAHEAFFAKYNFYIYGIYRYILRI